MLPTINRLTKKKDFELVFKKGESVKNGFLICKILKNNLQENRFGIVVSKKVSPKATVRNKLKRRLRDSVFGQLKAAGAAPSTQSGVFLKKFQDVIIIALPGADKKEFSEIKEKVAGFFNKYITQ